MHELISLFEYNKPPEFANLSSYWNSLGICSLRDTLECTVLENLNGTYELTLVYPDKGWKAEEIRIGRVIKTQVRHPATSLEESKMFTPWVGGNWNDYVHRLGWDFQFFYINDIDYSLEGVMTVRAVHYTYRLKEMSIDYYFSSNRVVTDISGEGYLPSDFIDGSIEGSLFRYSLFNNNTYSWENNKQWYRASDGKLATSTDNRKRAWFGDVGIYQDIDNFIEPQPWMPKDTLIPNYYVRTLKYPSRDNLANIIFGDHENSWKNQWKLEILRDRQYVLLTSKRSIKSWDDAYVLKYSRDITGLKVRTDLSDIITDTFPYYNFTGNNPATDTEMTRELNLVGDPSSPHGHSRIIPHKNDMRAGIAVDMSPYIDTKSLYDVLKGYMLQGNTWAAGAHEAGRPFVAAAFERFKARTDMCYGKLTADVDFIPLWDTQEARHRITLQRLRLGDPVNIDHHRLGTIHSKVTETVYNVLAMKYDSIKIESDSVVVV